jgi:hypothetical protein
VLSAIMLIGVMVSGAYAEHHNTKSCSDEWHYGEWHYAERVVC